ncbi:MAG: hypothetical protein NTV63_00025 [Candidatus Woesearchaeota archaeon]|nr:hypothetical protein [Candidatus Woesearchaeota archaeon]
MIERKDFEEIKNELEMFDSNREYLIGKTREIIRLSKRIIYSVHRNELSEAEKSAEEIRKVYAELEKEIAKVPALIYSGTLKNAMQEYVEALCFFEIIKEKRMPTHKELGVQGEHYLLGMCDLIGEISRIAINSAANGSYDFAIEMKGLVLEIYYELMKFDFPNGELRKKFDGIKYEIKRLEDMALALRLKR